MTRLQPPQPQRRAPALFSGALLGFLLVVFLAAFGYASYLFFQAARAIALSTPQLAQSDDRPGDSQAGSGAGADELSGGPDGNAFQPADETDLAFPAWNTPGRINILFLGIDQRPQQQGYFRTDTMIVLTADPSTGDVGMLSLPRDLWVTIPGRGEERINTAHVYGYLDKYPGGGPGLAKETVSQLLNQPIHYYVRMNFEGFRKIIEEIGCIEVDVPRDIDDPTFPDDNFGYDPFFIAAGHYCMDADTALKYARTRHADSDFGRMDRQQQVILAIKDKVLDTGQLPRLIARAPALLSALSESFQSDLPAGQLITLASMARRLNTDNIRRLVIDRTMAVGTLTSTGASVLVPQMDVIRPAVAAFFNPAPVPTPTPIADLAVRDQLALEQARVAVLNGSSDPELGRLAAEWLSSQGYQVVGFADADRNDYAQTQIIIRSDKPFTTRQLIDRLAIGDENIRPATDANPSVDIQLILGADFRLP
ncbi:MAG: LCP family protein [Caldilineales bacterium]|nr:LCP family protein [Caldilineales bacterium]MCW5860462.1 LCP family protein [Caldilineales bacterium]